MTVFLGSVSNHGRIVSFFAFLVDAQEESTISSELPCAQRFSIRQVVIEQRVLAVKVLQRCIGCSDLPSNEPDLIQRLAGLHLDGERARDHFKKQWAAVAGAYFVE